MIHHVTNIETTATNNERKGLKRKRESFSHVTGLAVATRSDEQALSQLLSKSRVMPGHAAIH